MTLDRLFKSVLKVAAVCLGLVVIFNFLLFVLAVVVSILDVMR